MAEGGYADISGGFSQNSLQAILALLQQQGQGGARPEGMAMEMPSSLRPIEPYSAPKPLTSGRGIEAMMPPEQMPYMAQPYTAPPSAERSGQVAQRSLGFQPGMQSMMGAKEMGVLSANPMASNMRNFAPQNYGGGVQSLPMNARTAAPAPAPIAPGMHLPPNMKEALASQQKMFAKREKMRLKGLKRMGY